MFRNTDHKRHCSKNECTKVQKPSLKRCYYECMLLSINNQQCNRASWAFLINSDSYLLKTGNKTSQVDEETLVTTRPKKQRPYSTFLHRIFDKMRMHVRLL